jgi:hypothetical protein
MNKLRRLFKMTSGLLTLTAIFAAPKFADAGPRVGNGGAGWVCQDRSTKAYRWIRLVDLFEAENEFGLKINPHAGSYREILDQKMATILREVPSLQKKLTTDAQRLISSITMVPDGSTLTRIDDGRIRVPPSPRSCQNGYLYYGQLANFTDDGRLLINGAYFQHSVFSETDRSALLLHEILYKSLRDTSGDTNSTRARQLVGLLFSDINSTELRADVEHVLSLPPPKDDKSDVILDTFEIHCRAATTAGSSDFSEHQFPGALQPGQKVTATLSQYSFEVEIHETSGLPSRMAIRDQRSGLSTFIDSEMIEAVIVKRKVVSVALDHEENKESALLACHLRTIEPSLFPRGFRGLNLTPR